MSVTFSDLIQIYRESEPLIGSEKRLFCIQTEQQLDILNQLLSDDNYENTVLESENTLELGAKVNLIFGTPKPQFGRFFNKLDDFIKGDITQFNNDALSNAPYFIKSENLASFDENVPILKSYQVVRDFLRQLIAMDSYTDVVNKKLIFFSKKTFELSIDVTIKLNEFIQLIRDLDDEQRKLIIDFQEWLNDEETSSHTDEKKSILAFVLSDSLPSDANFSDVIQQIARISESVQAQYALYLENFSYEKFVKKLEENTEKFVTKINDTISKVLPQFLGLPFLTAVPSALKSADNWLIYLALMLYCIICGYGLSNQKLVLDHIRQDVERFEGKGKIPGKLKGQWEEDKVRINKLLRKQRHLYRVLFLSLTGCFAYGFIRFLFVIKTFQIYCG
ncbi:hypothetical protein E4T80_05335 [Muribacter muris]|uniref:Uncharacterized protein n=3 Tax=Pseudomonadota TaxID=1224 RepID=A0A6L9Y9S7_9BURK|nr:MULTISPECIES: hypothetical protein [Pseudomonadota]MBF0784894.1 hypothetical protein [Muribacter muris]MBF0826513.1 hypothetical protein [Muribacter muris]MCX2961932.1 hypothetical protein [Rodentibacter heylii]MDC2825043.1 hypothetical protein [Rodentibacter pneumotropicus]NEN76568.1 hypothetical protein [Pelistega ratti]